MRCTTWEEFRQGSHCFNDLKASENDDCSSLFGELAGKEKRGCSGSRQGCQASYWTQLPLLCLLGPKERWEADFPGCRSQSRF